MAIGFEEKVSTHVLAWEADCWRLAIEVWKLSGGSNLSGLERHGDCRREGSFARGPTSLK